MSESAEESLGIAWLPALVEKMKSEPVFEEPRWNQILAELGRITAYFDTLESHLKLLLCALRRHPQLDMTRYFRTPISEVIEKCEKALEKLEANPTGRNPALLTELCKDCRLELQKCDKLRDRRNELIHAFWSPQTFPPNAATRIRPEKTIIGTYVVNPQGHDAAELRAVALEIRNAVPDIYALTIKTWAYWNPFHSRPLPISHLAQDKPTVLPPSEPLRAWELKWDFPLYLPQQAHECGGLSPFGFGGSHRSTLPSGLTSRNTSSSGFSSPVWSCG